MTDLIQRKTRAKFQLIQPLPNLLLFGLVAISIGLTLLTTTRAFALNSDKVCNRVADAADNACKNDAQDDYWINIGNCINTEDNQEALDCKEEAKEQLSEERELCQDQKQARIAICDALGGSAYQPDINPAQFLSPAAIAANPNPYFPLIPGLIKIFEAGDETITVTVTTDTIDILGVTCIVVRDIVEENGVVIEDTFDWYAQDIAGNVWYFGEISKNFEDGELTDLDGSWKAGVEEAQPGILMKANPMVGDIYRQEFALGEAEDVAEVISITETTESSPAADCSSTCVVTHDFLPIEPDADELKYYAPGIGDILVIDRTNGEREELVDIILP